MEKRKTLFKRQKILLALLQKFGGRLSSTDFQKYLFLFTQREKVHSYDFVPYKFGCFSFQSYADKRRLVEMGILANNHHYWQLVSENSDYSNNIAPSIQNKIFSFIEEFSMIKGNELVRYVYKNYPYFAINSQIADEIMDEEDLEKIDKLRSKDETFCFYTIGYEGISFDDYLNRLIRNNVKLLCDVRKNPISRKYGFSKIQLSNNVAKFGIEYVHMPELGIVSEKRQNLNTQKDYEYLFEDYQNTVLKHNSNAIRKLYRLFLDNKRIAITCFEANVCMCHRGRVALALTRLPDWNYKIKHI